MFLKLKLIKTNLRVYTNFDKNTLWIRWFFFLSLQMDILFRLFPWLINGVYFTSKNCSFHILQLLMKFWINCNNNQHIKIPFQFKFLMKFRINCNNKPAYLNPSQIYLRKPKKKMKSVKVYMYTCNWFFLCREKRPFFVYVLHRSRVRIYLIWFKSISFLFLFRTGRSLPDVHGGRPSRN